jgi:prepilin-type N-terminal cleavage/methylation domain-containing protein
MIMRNFQSERREKTQSSGFTLVETLIAVSILAIATAGPLYTASRALVAAETARDQLTASYLAQEGIEYVRMMRDDAFLYAYSRNDPAATANSWADFTSGASAWSITQCITNVCTLDPTLPMGYGPSSSLTALSGTMPLYLTNCPSGPASCTPPNIYTQRNLTDSMQTPFTRTIQVVSGTNEEKVISTVSWKFHETPYLVTITSRLTPWQ